MEEVVQSLRNERLANALHALLKSDDGKVLLWFLLDSTNLLGGSYRTDEHGVYHTEFNEGRRSLGVDLNILLSQIDPHYFGKLQGAAVDREMEFLARAENLIEEEQDDG